MSGKEQLSFLDEPTAQLLARRLRGISGVRLRILGAHPAAEAETVALLQSLGMLVDVVRISAILPPPLSRFSFRYEGRNATVTLSPEAPLKG